MAPEADSSEPPYQGGAGFAKPSSEPVSVARVEILSKYKMAILLYTAALASFKFWGLPHQENMETLTKAYIVLKFLKFQ